MLARVANNLYWMGRYIERTEHVARYMRVNYFSSLDAPNSMSQSRQFVLSSLLYMVGLEEGNPEEELDEKDVLYTIGLDPECGVSIIRNISLARENANSARDLLSTELYESINKFYHYALNYPVDVFLEKGLFDFTVNVTEMASSLRARTRVTLLHNEVLSIIMLGFYMERATQMIRIINAKYNDAKRIREKTGEPLTNSFEWITLLKCAEAYDMMRRHYKKTPQSRSTLEFLILHPDCPRSVMFSLNKLNEHIRILDERKHPLKNSTAFLVGKTRAEYEFMLIDEVAENVEEVIQEILNKMMVIGNHMEKEFFNF